MAKTYRHAEKLLEELQALSAEERAKLLKLIRFLKKEILPQTPARSDLKEPCEAYKAAVLRHAGLLADLTPEEEQRFLEAVRRWDAQLYHKDIRLCRNP